MNPSLVRTLPLSVRWRTVLRHWLAGYLAFWNRHPIDQFWPPHP